MFRTTIPDNVILICITYTCNKRNLSNFRFGASLVLDN